MSQVLNHAEFYESTMAANGRDLIDEDAVLQKIAEKNDIPFEQAKLAQVYYEQLQKDELLAGEVWYDNDQDRRDDAFKLAEAYQAHVQDTTKVAEAKANRLLEKLAAVAEEWAEDAGLGDEFSATELVKIAGLQAESVIQYEQEVAELQEKIAAGYVDVPLPEPEVGENDEIIKEASDLVKTAVADLYTGPQSRPEDVILDKALPYVGQAYAAGNPTAATRTPEQHAQNAQQYFESMGVRDPAQQRSFIHNTLSHHANTGESITDSLRTVGDSHLRNTTGVKGFVNRNKVPLAVGGAALGLGALAYMKNRRDDTARQKRLQHLRAQAQQPAETPQEQPQEQPQGVAHV